MDSVIKTKRDAAERAIWEAEAAQRAYHVALKRAKQHGIDVEDAIPIDVLVSDSRQVLDKLLDIRGGYGARRSSVSQDLVSRVADSRFRMILGG